jgi:hypothetical protein
VPVLAALIFRYDEPWGVPLTTVLFAANARRKRRRGPTIYVRPEGPTVQLEMVGARTALLDREDAANVAQSLESAAIHVPEGACLDRTDPLPKVALVDGQVWVRVGGWRTALSRKAARQLAAWLLSPPSPFLPVGIRGPLPPADPVVDLERPLAGAVEITCGEWSPAGPVAHARTRGRRR